MYRLPGDRIALDLDGPSVEVEPIHAWPIQFEGQVLLGRFMAADKPVDEYAALNRLYEFVVAEARPQWDIVDHNGPVPATARGMARLPVKLGIEIANGWLGTLIVPEQESSAVDAVIPPGPMNDEIKQRLRVVKRKSKAA